jgi:hypothetical protein
MFTQRQNRESGPNANLHAGDFLERAFDGSAKALLIGTGGSKGFQGGANRIARVVG